MILLLILLQFRLSCLCQDLLARRYPAYEFDEIHRIVPSEGSKVINFDEMKELLLSTDMNRYNEIDNTNEHFFLDASVNLAHGGNCIAI